MRRLALLASTLATAGLLSACAGSGYWSYLGDTAHLPFHDNPNIAHGEGETYTKVRAKNVETPPRLLYEAGDIWPPPPEAPPTLRDLQAQQNRELGSANGGYTKLQPLPQIPGYEVPEQQTHAAAPAGTFSSGVVPGTHGGNGIPTAGGSSFGAPSGNGTIVVPNGNGTSTVIGPDGSVKTVPTPGK